MLCNKKQIVKNNKKRNPSGFSGQLIKQSKKQRSVHPSIYVIGLCIFV
jgi:hypothetical protein